MLNRSSVKDDLMFCLDSRILVTNYILRRTAVKKKYVIKLTGDVLEQFGYEV